MGMGVDYISILHLFIIIMIMGIGADNIFVFHDFWMHTKHIKALRKRPPLRLAYTLRKASHAMMTTSVTTAVSFLSTCMNPIMPIVSFGLFAFVVVVINVIFLLAVVPSIYMLYENDVNPVLKKICFCCYGGKK